MRATVDGFYGLGLLRSLGTTVEAYLLLDNRSSAGLLLVILLGV